MKHVILLGDSIFDNDRYVPGGTSVIQHLRRCLPGDWQATLLARDGAVSSEVDRQLSKLPEDATHLIVSAGGNDALECSLVLFEPALSLAEALSNLADIREQFQHNYRQMLEGVLAHGKPTAVCTVYDAIPNLDRIEKTGLSLFNEVILREAFRAAVPVIDLRLICNEVSDYAASSPIEPSASGGGKIARTICRVLTTCDFERDTSRVFAF